MSDLDDSWLSTRNRTKIVPKKKDVVKKRSSLPKPRKSSNCAAFPMTQNSPPPKLLHTATKQSKLNDFFKPGDTGPKKCLKEKRQATEVSPGEVGRRTNPDGSRSNKLDTSDHIKIPGCLSGTAVDESKPCHYQGKENISNLNEKATNEHNMWKGCLHEAEKCVAFHGKYDMNSYNFDTFSLQHPAHKFQDAQRNHASWLSNKHRQGVKRDISLDEIDKTTVCKRHKKENTCNDTEVLSKLDDDIPSHRLHISNGVHSKATEEKTAHEKTREEFEENQKNIATDEEIAHDEQFLHLSQCFQKSSSTKALDSANTNKEAYAHNNVEEDVKAIQQDCETKDTANNKQETSTMYKTADVIQFDHTRVNAKVAHKLTDIMIDTDYLSRHDNSSLDLSVVDNSELSQDQDLLLETQLHSQIADDDDDNENTELDLENMGDSMGQSLELCTQFTLSSQ